MALMPTNNASSFSTPVNEDNISDWDDLINSNVKGPLISKYFADYLKKPRYCHKFIRCNDY